MAFLQGHKRWLFSAINVYLAPTLSGTPGPFVAVSKTGGQICDEAVLEITRRVVCTANPSSISHVWRRRYLQGSKHGNHPSCPPVG